MRRVIGEIGSSLDSTLILQSNPSIAVTGPAKTIVGGAKMLADTGVQMIAAGALALGSGGRADAATFRHSMVIAQAR